MSRKALSTAATVAGVLVALGFAAGIVQSVIAEGQTSGYSRASDDNYWSWTDQRGPVLSIDEIARRVQDQGYTDIREIERKRGKYKVEARDPEGLGVKLYVDATTGEILRRKAEDD
jgi:uncharacterized membrane protein YkoI